MSQGETPLGTYQKWMRSVVTHPGSDSDAWLSEQAQEEMPLPKALEYIESSSSLSQMERVGIYRKMYFLRMRDSLEMDYPGILFVLGQDRFEQLVRDYCEVHPSKSYTLNHLGDSFPDFLAVYDLEHAEDLADLARFELAMTKLLDANRVKAMTAGDLRKLQQGGLENLHLKTVESVRLLHMRRPYHTYLHSAYQDEEAVFPPAKKDTWLVIYQDHEFDIVWREVSHPEFVLLEAFQKGMTLTQGMEYLAKALPNEAESAAAEVGGWLSEWLELEFFEKPETGR